MCEIKRKFQLFRHEIGCIRVLVCIPKINQKSRRLGASVTSKKIFRGGPLKLKGEERGKEGERKGRNGGDEIGGASTRQNPGYATDVVQAVYSHLKL